MSMSLLVRKAVGCWALALALPGLASGQASYAPNGPEYAVPGPLPGDQLHPQLGLSPAGGFLVWDDNATDFDGTGIMAQALDNRLAKVQAPFRVNHIALGNHEFPQVTLLKGGGAVFTWQGGPPAKQNIYARFLSPTNTWLSDDLVVNSFTQTGFRRHPALAPLTNGNVVIVYASFNQQAANSMQDVYGQILNPAGQKVGGEFLVNQFTPFNQFAPAVAPLADGGFVVVWISEQENNAVDCAAFIKVHLQLPAGLPSVDVYARRYDAAGSPLGDELLVNTAPNPCSDPTVAGAPDGGFLVAWGQRDLANSANGVDIFARPFSSQTIGGAVQRVNAYLKGNQYAPQVSSVGGDYLVVWTSDAQDGSGKGVFGRFLQADASALTPEFRVNTTAIFDQMHPAVSSVGDGRFLTVWTSFVGGRNSFDLLGQVYAPPNYSPGPPSPQPVFSAPAFDPFMYLPAPAAAAPATVASASAASAPVGILPPVLLVGRNTLTNAFVLAQGTYSGLFSDTNDASALSSGYFSASVTRGGAYSAKLLLGAQTYSMAGKFNPATGLDTQVVKRAQGLAPLTVQLQLDLSTGEQISGFVAGGSAWSAELFSFRQVFNRSANAATAFAASYTLVIPADLTAPNTPGGHGCGTIIVDTAGNVRWSGALADGTKVTQSTTLSRQGYWPLYASAYSGGGFVLSWAQFASQAGYDVDGQTIWLKPATPRAQFYRAAFTNEVMSIGSLYAAPRAGTPLMGLSNAMVVLGGGDLTGSVTNAFSLNARNAVIRPAGSKLSLTLNTASGLFNGAVSLTPRLTLSFQGVLFQKLTNGFGYFLGTNQAGQVYLGPEL